MSESAALAPVSVPAERREPGADILADYLETLSLIERLHRLLLDVIKDELERLGRFELSAVQALLLFNIGDKVISAGELRTRGYYQGSNVSYNLKKLVEGGYIHHERSEVDRRSVRVRLTGQGREVHELIAALFRRNADELCGGGRLQGAGLARMNNDLRSLERYWAERIRYIY